MFHLATTLPGVTNTVAVFALQKAPAKGPNLDQVIGWARTVFTIIMICLACAAGWKGLRKGGKPSDALEYVVVAVLVGFAYNLADPGYMAGTYSWVTGTLNGG